ncbi:transposase [bacterium]|nr:transposase [bacterium]
MNREAFLSSFHPHRPPREAYAGVGTVFFTFCVENRRPVLGGEVAHECVAVLRSVLPRHASRGDVFCFMPDHAHVLASGMLESADVWQAIVELKQITGRWFWERKLGIRWQRGFDARIMKPHQSLDAVIAYIRGNPVRRGLVRDCRDYAYSGSVPWQSWRYHV